MRRGLQWWAGAVALQSYVIFKLHVWEDKIHKTVKMQSRAVNVLGYSKHIL